MAPPSMTSPPAGIIIAYSHIVPLAAAQCSATAHCRHDICDQELLCTPMRKTCGSICLEAFLDDTNPDLGHQGWLATLSACQRVRRDREPVVDALHHAHCSPIPAHCCAGVPFAYAPVAPSAPAQCGSESLSTLLHTLYNVSCNACNAKPVRITDFKRPVAAFRASSSTALLMRHCTTSEEDGKSAHCCMLQGSESCDMTVLFRLHWVISTGSPSSVSMQDSCLCRIPPPQGALHSPGAPISRLYLGSAACMRSQI